MEPEPRRTGLLLLNLGTPDSPRPEDVRRYLAEFLSDPRVLDIPGALRWALLNGVILRSRPRQSAAAYARIWGPEGSPLLVHSRALRDAVAEELGEGFQVELGMRYGRPGLADAFERLCQADLERMLVLPLFPQYASSAGGSAAARVLELASRRWNVPPLEVLGDFHQEAGFVEAVAEVAGPLLRRFAPDHVLFSYHGLPERHVRKSDVTGSHCLRSPDCCETLVAANRYCYRAQCHATTRALVRALRLPAERSSLSFQSRLGRQPWIQPYTDEVLPQLAERGVRRLAVLCPSFVADCLETVEEIGIRGREQWLAVGGEELLLVPCPNAHPRWVRAVADRVRRRCAGTAPAAKRGDLAVAGSR